jgi:N-acetylglucosaminyldiphosphoundecaprenol N-acetyl-beta-D-mannosaminyltransferase
MRALYRRSRKQRSKRLFVPASQSRSAPPSTTATDDPPNRVERQRLFGLPVHAVTLAQASQFAVDAVATRDPRCVLFVNVAKVVMARQDPRLRDALERADLVAVDGQPVVWASRLLHRPVPARVPGVDFFNEVLSLADRFGWRVFFLGSTDEILDEVEEHCRSKLPGLVVAGRHHGYFPPADEGRMADLIREARADALFVALPSPRKECWLSAYAQRSGVSLAAAVGGSYEVLVGRVRRAPPLWQRAGLEWFWRTLQEPRRLWRRYLETNSRFLLILASEWLRSRRGSAS